EVKEPAEQAGEPAEGDKYPLSHHCPAPLRDMPADPTSVENVLPAPPSPWYTPGAVPRWGGPPLSPPGGGVMGGEASFCSVKRGSGSQGKLGPVGVPLVWVAAVQGAQMGDAVSAFLAPTHSPQAQTLVHHRLARRLHRTRGDLPATL